MHRLAIRERQRNLDAERMERARAEANAVTTGVAETVSLQEARGQVFAHPVQKRGERAKPVRRISALERAGLSRTATEAGHQYAELTMRLTPRSPKSCLVQTIGGGMHAVEARLGDLRKRETAWLSIDFDASAIRLLDRLCAGDESLSSIARGDTKQAASLREKASVALERIAKAWGIT